MNNERLAEIVKLSREAGLDLIRKQAAAGASVEWKQPRTAAVQAAAVMACIRLADWKPETLPLQNDDGTYREVETHKVLNRALSIILDSWLSQTSTQQKAAVKAGIYKAPKGKERAIVDDALSGIE